MRFCWLRGKKSYLMLLSASLWLGLVALCGCRNEKTSSEQVPVTNKATPASADAVETVPPLYFTDAADAAGIAFRHYNGAFGLKMFPEAMGSGVVWFDYDDDGWPDLFFVNGRDWTEKEINAFRNRPWSQAELSALQKREGTKCAAPPRNPRSSKASSHQRVVSQ